MNNICIFAPMGGFGHHTRWIALLDKRFQRADDELTLAEKVAYVRDIVYNVDHPHNYIEQETKHQRGLNELIYFNHQLDKENRVTRLKNQHGQQFFHYDPSTKFLCCLCNPQIALKAYKRLRPELNDWSEAQFVERAELDNILSMTMPQFHSNTFFVNNDVLINDQLLDRDYYETLISHLGLDNNYDAACEIHDKWWSLRRDFEENESA